MSNKLTRKEFMDYHAGYGSSLFDVICIYCYNRFGEHLTFDSQGKHVKCGHELCYCRDFLHRFYPVDGFRFDNKNEVLVHRYKYATVHT